MLYLRDNALPLIESEFYAALHLTSDGNWDVDWRFDVRARGQVAHDGQPWEAHLHSQCDIRGLPDPYSLSGFSTVLAADEDDEPPFLLYVFGHEPVREVRIRFGERTARGYEFSLRGTADIGWDEPLLNDVPILLECDLPFAGVLVDEHKEHAARLRLESRFGPLEWGAPTIRNFQHLFPLLATGA